MSEFNRETNTPSAYETALADFFALLNRGAASESTIRLSLGVLFQHSVQTTPQHLEKLLAGLSERFTYDTEGILLTGPANEGDPDDVQSQKAQLLGAVTGLLVASEYSMLTFNQRDSLLCQATDLAENLGTAGLDLLGEDMLMHIGREAELAELFADRERSRRGRFVLDIVHKYGLINNKIRHTYRSRF